MKKLTCLLLVLLMLFGLTACSRPETPDQTKPTAAAPAETVSAEALFETQPPAFSVEQESIFASDGGIYLTVEEKPLSDFQKEAFLASGREQFLPYAKALMIDDIPAILVNTEDGKSKPIQIVIHAGGGSKEDMIWSSYCADNFIWVTFDVGGYGESPRGGMTDGEAVIQAINDIDKLIAYCSTLPGADINRVVVTGSSMGASAVFAHLGYGYFRPALVNAGLATADFTTAPDSSPLFLHHGGDRPTPDLTMDQMRELLAAYSPHTQAERMMDTFVLAGMGLQDTIADTPSCQRLEETFRQMGKTNFDFRYYDVGHGQFPDEYGATGGNLAFDVQTGKLSVQNQPVPVHINEEEPPAQQPASVQKSDYPPFFNQDGSLTLTLQQNRPLTQRAQQELSAMTLSNVTVDSILVNRIPTLIAYPDNTEKKPIYIMLHDRGGCKEDNLYAMESAVKDLNAIWVSPDLGVDGENTMGAMSDAEVIGVSAAITDMLIAYCSTLPGADLSRIVVDGTSLGGTMALIHAACGWFAPALVIAQDPLADLTLPQAGDPIFQMRGSIPRTEPEASIEELMQLMRDYSPYHSADRMTNTFLLAGIRLQGDPLSVQSCKALEEVFREMGNTNFDFRYYDTDSNPLPEDYRDAGKQYLQQVKNGSLSAVNPPVTVTLIEE